MKNYTTLFFDIDNTLLDFDASEREGLKKVFDQYGINYSTENIQIYQEINHQLWRDFEEGKISRDDLLEQRFGLFFKAIDLEGKDSSEAEKSYRGYLAQGHEAIKGAMTLLSTLQQMDKRLVVVTNGVSKTQYKRLDDAKMTRFFETIIVSEDTGYQKPMPEFFDYVFERIPNLDLESSLIIGDSLTSDIQGGINVGMDTCWFNLRGEISESVIKPKYTITKLSELLEIVE